MSQVTRKDQGGSHWFEPQLPSLNIVFDYLVWALPLPLPLFSSTIFPKEQEELCASAEYVLISSSRLESRQTIRPSIAGVFLPDCHPKCPIKYWQNRWLFLVIYRLPRWNVLGLLHARQRKRCMYVHLTPTRFRCVRRGGVIVSHRVVSPHVLLIPYRDESWKIK